MSRGSLRTPRLLLRPYSPDDVDALHRLWLDPGVRRYLWDDVVIPRATAAAVVTASVADWAAHGYGQWNVTVPPSTDTDGFVGFRAGESPGRPELLFGLLPRWWGQGIADEAARAVLAHGFEALGLTAVWAGTDPPNLASQRLLGRLGMVLERREGPAERELLVYGLTPERFADSWIVRPARADEVAALPALEVAASERFRDAGIAGDSLPLATTIAGLEAARVAGRLWVAALGAGLVAGFAHAVLVGGTPHLEEVDVLPTYGRRGLGTALVRAVVGWARAAGHRELTLTTFRDVPWNAPYYRRLGFRDLDAAALPPALEALVADEERRGLPRAQRVVLRLDLTAAV